MNFDLTLFAMLIAQTNILIAGCCGSGKSVLLNGIIYTLLQHTPNRFKLVLCDPKRVEFAGYKHAPHCIAYGNDCETIINALKFVHAEMMGRYERMERAGLRKTAEPHIFVIIDELADLMLNAPREVKPLLQSLNQLGRAAGIHVIAATQCPARKILPAEITLNFTCKIALRCDSATESRQILGVSGAENLQGVGKCLIKSPENREPIRETIPYIPDSELSAAVDRWKRPEPKPAQPPTAYQITPEATQTRTEAPRKRGFLAELIKCILYP